MALQIQDEGVDNQVDLEEGVAERVSGTIRLRGNGNRVRLGANCSGKGVSFQLTGGADVTIGASCRLGSLRIHAVQGAVVTVGPRCIFNGRSRLLLHEAATIAIGARCLFGSDCTLMVSDVHSLLSATTDERINAAKSVSVGQHVWIAGGVMLLKGSSIGRDSVIGTRSVVTGKVPPNAVAAGNPARVVREGVTWDHRLR